MAIIDFTAQMAPVGMSLLALLAMTVVGIGSCIDDGERQRARSAAQRVGAWWLGRGGCSRERRGSTTVQLA